MSNDTLKPLSIQRVKDVFSKQGWQFDEASEFAIRTGFARIGLEIAHIAPNINVISSVAVDSIGADRYEDIRNWAEQYNYTKAYPTVTALKDEERGVTALGVAYSLPGHWEYTDNQFESHILTGIQGVVAASRDFLTEFAPEVTQRLDEEAAQD
ncbi:MULTISPECIES: hypothetical protein [unclassified Corynebacterium]|uniref:hypothetical protein n=1 Tax=unclassified Corynebacterium TaxID=2624378 RepID=UPI001EF68ADD|nr:MULTISPECIES: hypothetical protein [unclassified Corynebacterium]MCG7289523.1 hypothetical protein [Corynebacterium sp. ACRPZ]MCG7293912.1 hypothetical protein [Corynebacterium sp. ACRPY]